MSDDERAGLEAELERVRAELEERRRSLPAHSVRPHQVQAIEALEERLVAVLRRLGLHGEIGGKQGSGR